mmetsp:Transcript_44108/g.70871  ORF Transcript_44108/g.70871 Transcript_44108/m.70871 type:complete len:170 (-) Transcript_44108:219-728(-)
MVFVFTLRQAPRRCSTRYPYGPCYFIALAALCILADNSRHVLQDLGFWPPGPWPGSSQYRGDCEARWISNTVRDCSLGQDCGPVDCGGGFYSAAENVDCYTCLQTGQFANHCTTNAESFSCLSPVGWIFTIFLTYFGFGLLAAGSAWNAQLLTKLTTIRTKWHELRALK